MADRQEPVGPAVRAAFVGGRPHAGRARHDPGFGHATPIDPDAAGAPCGRAGPFILDADVCSTAEIARFFGLTGQPPSITIDPAVVVNDEERDLSFLRGPALPGGRAAAAAAPRAGLRLVLQGAAAPAPRPDPLLVRRLIEARTRVEIVALLGADWRSAEVKH